MAQNTQSYGWHNRSSHPLQSPSIGADQQLYSPPPTLPPAGFAVGYNPQQSSQSYYHPASSSQYLSQPNLPHDRNWPRRQAGPICPSAPPYTFPSLSGSPPALPDHGYASPPPYMPQQSNYMLSQSPLLPPHPNPLPVSPPAHIVGPAESLYSSPESIPASSDVDRQVRVISSRPKPQCWDHGCNGREFSTFSNLLRHQREKSGVVAKAECPSCGAVFTRTTARNIHVAQGKCKSGRDSSTD
ncbi:hypothetical protein IFM47457_05674 [Aspergillus lentulus]|nr:hypothetical protein IFM47457_05674 [Aspergillus lentulus]